MSSEPSTSQNSLSHSALSSLYASDNSHGSPHFISGEATKVLTDLSLSGDSQIKEAEQVDLIVVSKRINDFIEEIGISYDLEEACSKLYSKLGDIKCHTEIFDEARIKAFTKLLGVANTTQEISWATLIELGNLLTRFAPNNSFHKISYSLIFVSKSNFPFDHYKISASADQCEMTKKAIMTLVDNVTLEIIERLKYALQIIYLEDNEKVIKTLEKKLLDIIAESSGSPQEKLACWLYLVENSYHPDSEAIRQSFIDYASEQIKNVCQNLLISPISDLQETESIENIYYLINLHKYFIIYAGTEKENFDLIQTTTLQLISSANEFQITSITFKELASQIMEVYAPYDNDLSVRQNINSLLRKKNIPFLPFSIYFIQNTLEYICAKNPLYLIKLEERDGSFLTGLMMMCMLFETPGHDSHHREVVIDLILSTIDTSDEGKPPQLEKEIPKTETLLSDKVIEIENAPEAIKTFRELGKLAYGKMKAISDEMQLIDLSLSSFTPRHQSVDLTN